MVPFREVPGSAGSVPTAATLPTAPVLPAMPLAPPTPTLSINIDPGPSALAALGETAARDWAPRGIASEETTPLPVSAIDELPTLVSDLRPLYPEQLRAANVNGNVVVEYVIDSGGRVVESSIRIVRSDHPAFTRAVREALLIARFRAGRRAGQSVAVLVRQRIRFQTEHSR